MAKRTRTAIPDSEWVITCQLTQGEDNHPVGPPIEMHFADSYVAKNVGDVDYLIGRRLEEAIPALKKAAAKAKKAKKA
jgi:hypothetical protein